MTDWLRDEIDKSFVAPWHGATERSVFGDLDANEIVAALDRACADAFGAGLDDGFLYRVSVGCVVGCRLTDGREIVLKAYQRRWTPQFLAAVKRVQSHLHDAGFPCPEPIGAPFRVAGAVALAEHVLVDPGLTAPEGAMRPSAGGLARVVELSSSQHEPGLAAHPLRSPDDGLFPEPHSPLFDFDATAAGAEWIDAIARRARSIRDRDTSAPVIAHTDWSLRNVRLDATGPIAVYDWDSLALVPESHAVGGAAATWCKTGEPDGDPTPSRDDIEDYITEYEAARGASFSPTQRRATHAAAVWNMAYTARCEHSIDPGEQRWTTTRPRLRADADALLSE